MSTSREQPTAPPQPPVPSARELQQRYPEEALSTSDRLDRARNMHARVAATPMLAAVRGLARAHYRRRWQKHLQTGLETFEFEDADTQAAWLDQTIQDENSLRVRTVAQKIDESLYRKKSQAFTPFKERHADYVHNQYLKAQQHSTPVLDMSRLHAATRSTSGMRRRERRTGIGSKGRLALGITVGALALGSVASMFAGELTADKDTDSNRSGDQAAETTTLNQANQSFKNVSSISLMGAAKRQQMVIENFCRINNIDESSMSQADMDLVKAGKGAVVLERLNTKDDTGRSWQPITDAPDGVWAARSDEGVNVWANPNDPKSNGVEVISRQVAELETDDAEVTQAQVSELANAVLDERAKQGKPATLQPKEKVSFSKRLLRRVLRT